MRNVCCETMSVTLKISHFSWDFSRCGSAEEYRSTDTDHVRVTLHALALKKEHGLETRRPLFPWLVLNKRRHHGGLFKIVTEEGTHP